VLMTPRRRDPLSHRPQHLHRLPGGGSVVDAENLSAARHRGGDAGHGPGIDFAKQRDDNLTVYRFLDRLQRFDRPLMVPVSRKTVIGEVLGLTDPTERDAGTVACIAASMSRGAQIFRVHHVAAAWQAVKMLWAV